MSRMKDIPILKKGEKFNIRSTRTSISRKKLQSIIDDLLNGIEDESLGYYKLGKYNIDIFYDRSTTERCKDIYARRRANGLCAGCGKPVTEINYRTGKKYRYCKVHRRKYDKVNV